METDSVLRIEPGPDGNSVRFKDRRLSSAHPKTGAERRLPPGIEPRTCYLFLSPLQGYGLAKLCSNIPKSSLVVTLELEPMLDAVSNEPDNELINCPAIRHFSSSFNSHPVTAIRRYFVREARKRGIRNLVVLHLSAGYSLHRSRYDALGDELREDLARVWRNRGTEIALGRRWIANVFTNLSLSHRSANELGMLVENAVLLVGAGPSLDNSLATLIRTAADSRSKVSIVALDTALPVLAEHGVVPDVIVAMDAQIYNVLDLMPWRWSSCSIVADLTCHPSFVRKFPPDRRFFFLSDFAPIDLIEELRTTCDIPVLPPLASVAGAAAYLLNDAKTQTGSPIRVVTVGLDFVHGTGTTHARMSPYHRRTLAATSRTNSILPIPPAPDRPTATARNRRGGRTPSDPVLVRQAEILSHVLQQASIDGPAWTAVGDGLALGVPNAVPETVRFETDISLTRPAGMLPDPAPTGHQITHGLLLELREAESALEKPGQDPIAALSNRAWEIVTLDLPDMAALFSDSNVRREQQTRIVRSLRDIRRRLDRALSCPAVTRRDRI